MEAEGAEMHQRGQDLSDVFPQEQNGVTRVERDEKCVEIVTVASENVHRPHIQQLGTGAA